MCSLGPVSGTVAGLHMQTFSSSSRRETIATLAKGGVVLGGYIAAFLVASAAVALRVAHTSGPDAQASAGMYAFGDGLLFLAVFGAIAVVPTGAGLFFLRPYRPFWSVLSVVVLGLAATGVAAFMVYALASWRSVPGSTLTVWASLAVLRMLVAPPLAGSFILSAVIAPNRSSRWKLLVAAAMEGVVSIFAVLQWFTSFHFL